MCSWVLNFNWLYRLYVSTCIDVMAGQFPGIRERCRQHLEAACTSSGREFWMFRWTFQVQHGNLGKPRGEGSRVRFGRIFEPLWSHVHASLRTFVANRYGRKVDMPSSSDSGCPVLSFRFPGCGLLWVRGCWFLFFRSWFGVPGSWLRVPGSWFLLLASFRVLGSWLLVFGLWFRVISLFPVLGPWFLGESSDHFDACAQSGNACQ